MAFTITITETKMVHTITPKWWEILEKRPDGHEVRGYTPQEEERRIEEIKRLEQTVETLDMAAVIRAINDLA
jgi:hypothetical protein